MFSPFTMGRRQPAPPTKPPGKLLPLRPALPQPLPRDPMNGMA